MSLDRALEELDRFLEEKSLEEQGERAINYSDLLISELQRGNIPYFFRQECEIIDESHSYARKAEAYLKTIIDKLPKKHLQTSDIKILISSSSDPNAFVISRAQPPIMVVNVGLLQLATSEDEIVGVIAHELMHLDLASEFPDHGNNKANESMCDCASISALDRAGYRKDGLITLLARFPETDGNIFQTMFDPHPSRGLRIKNTGNYLAIYERETGLARKSMYTPVAPFIHEEKTQFTYYLDTLLIEQGYHQASVDKKIQTIRALIKTNKNIFRGGSAKIFSTRINKIKELIASLKINLQDSTQKEAFNQLVDTILLLDNQRIAESLYSSACVAAAIKKERYLLPYNYRQVSISIEDRDIFSDDRTQQWKPMGTLEEFQKLVSQFVQAISLHQAAKLAERINAKAREVARLLMEREGRSANDYIRMQGFELPKAYRYSIFKRKQAELPWSRHLLWSKTNLDIRTTLGHLKVLAVVKTRYPQDEVSALGYEIVLPCGADRINAFKFPSETQLAEMSDGKIHFEKKSTYPSPAEEVEKLKRKDHVDRELSIDWDLLDSNHHQFIKHYEYRLAFEKVIIDQRYGYYFAKKIISKIRKMAERDPAKSALLFKDIIESAWKNIRDNYKKSFGDSEKSYESGVCIRHPFITYALEHKLHDLIEYDNLLYYSTDLVYQLIDRNLSLPSLEQRWLFDEYEMIFQLNNDRSTFDNLFKIGTQKTTLWSFEAIRILNRNLSLTIDDLAYLYSSRASQNQSNEIPLHLQKYSVALERAEKNLFDALLQSENLKWIIRGYHLFHNKGNIFKNYDNVKLFEQAIVRLYQAVASLEGRLTLLENLLFTARLCFDPKYNIQELPVTPKFIEPAFKNWVIDEYSRILSLCIGKDTGEQEYEAKAKAIILKVIQFPLNLAVPLLKKLADELLAQRPLSYFIRDEIYKATHKKILHNGALLGGFGEALVTAITESREDKLKTDTMEFLLSKENEFHLESYVIKLINQSHKLRNELGMTKMGLYTSEECINEFHKNKKIYLDRFKAMREFYRDLSFDQQILVIDQFLFPANKNMALAFGKKYVLDKLFFTLSGAALLGMIANSLTGGIDNRTSDKESRQIVESYLESLETLALDETHKTSLESREKLILAGMLIAHAKTSETQGPKAGRGEALKMVLDAMGPAGRKLAQAIESHPQTPADLKKALVSSKTKAAPPARWEVHEWAEKYYSSDLCSIDEMLGSGSYGVTMRVKKNSGEVSAITFLRPYAAEQAQDEFRVLDEAAKILIQKNSVFKPFDAMQHEAAISFRKEVSMSVAAKQQKHAEQLYEGLVITVDNYVFRFGVAEWIGHNDNYKETKVIPGYHFNDLDHSAELAPIKNQAAQALLAAELYFLLRGGYLDNDRHGGQQKLQKISEQEIYIGNFDFGGMSLLPQTNWQKQLLGRMLGEALWEAAKPIGSSRLDGELLNILSEKYIYEFKNKTFTGHDGKAYLIGLEKAEGFVGRLNRGLLALGNYMSALSNQPEKLKIILGAVLASGQIDSVINAGIREQLGSFQGKLDELAESKEVETVRISKCYR